MSLIIDLYHYINFILRNRLNFRELYEYPIFDTERSVIYFNKDSSNFFDLKSILLTDKNLVSKIKEDTIFIIKIYNKRINIKEVKLLINNEVNKKGIGIIIISDKQIEGYLTYFDIIPELYLHIEIVSNFDTEKEINIYCQQFINLCYNEEFWRGLMKRIYPFRYTYEYNYEKLYKEYLLYKKIKFDKELGIPTIAKRIGNYYYNDLSSVKDIVRFTILENIIDKSKLISYIHFAFEIQDQRVLDKIKQSGIPEDELIEEILGDLGGTIAIVAQFGPEYGAEFIKGFLRLDLGGEYNIDWKLENIFDILRNNRIWNINVTQIIFDELPQELKGYFQQQLRNININLGRNEWDNIPILLI